MDSVPETTTRAWVLLPDIKTKLRHRSTQYSLVEAVSLANALPNLCVVGELVVYFRSVNPGTFFGKGKISELEAIFKSSNVELVLIDGHISPVQQRNLEKKWNVKILDRTGLILEIFSDFERESRPFLQQKKEQGILHSKYPINLTDRRVYLTKMLPSMMIKQINEGTLYDVAPSEDSHGDLDENTPMLNIAQDTLDKFLPSF